MPAADGRNNNCGSKQRHRFTYEDQAGVLDFVQAAKDRGKDMNSVCFDDSPGGALSEYPFLAQAKFKDCSMLSKWVGKAQRIYAMAADELRKRLKGGGRRRSRESGRWSVMEQRLFKNFKDMRYAFVAALSAARGYI